MTGTTAPLHIMWFRQDLRLNDNPALSAAVAAGHVLPVYILDNDNAGDHQLGAASRWWLHHSLHALATSLGGALNVYQGDAGDIIHALCQRYAVSGVYWNRCYEPWRRERDQIIKQQLSERGIVARSFNSSLLHEPWSVLKADGKPYKVFTPYHRAASALPANTATFAAPKPTAVFTVDNDSGGIDTLQLLPRHNWDKQFYDCWTPGEDGARTKLQQFLQTGLHHYQQGRDFPAQAAVSRLSPHLHFGELSPQYIVNTLAALPATDNSDHFLRELRWREFSYYLLYHWPSLPHANLKPQFNHFAWQQQPSVLARWQQGQTGYPMVDAGMRELWQTGFMHNRVRMITASFLVKNLLQDWRAGAHWFWDCLVDADLASNSASWQWVAGCGTDASPYFRIFNPVTQGQKFDPNGDYIRRFVPELRHLPDTYLHQPWLAPTAVLAEANVRLGETYPAPMVDLKTSRERALAAYAELQTER